MAEQGLAENGDQAAAAMAAAAIEADIGPSEQVRHDTLGAQSCAPRVVPKTAHSLENGGQGRNRTGVHGFAGRCITTLPPGHPEGFPEPSLSWPGSALFYCIGHQLREPDTAFQEKSPALRTGLLESWSG